MSITIFAPSRTQEDLLRKKKKNKFNKNRVCLREKKTIETTTNRNNLEGSGMG